MNWNATAKVCLEFVKHEGGQFAASRFHLGQERRPVFLYRSEKQGRFGAMAFVRGRARGRVSVTACCWLRGKHQQELSATGRTELLAERRIQRNLWPGMSPGLGATIGRYSPFGLYFAPASRLSEEEPFARSSATINAAVAPRRGSVRPAKEAWRSRGLGRSLRALVQPDGARSAVLADTQGFLIASAGEPMPQEGMAAFTAIASEMVARTRILLPLADVDSIRVRDTNRIILSCRLFQTCTYVRVMAT